jgi:hypothetical protein
MDIHQALKWIETIGAIALFGGLCILTVLYIKISKRLNKSYVTFLSVFKIPKIQLLEGDKRLRKIGGFLLLSGIVILIITNLMLISCF